MSNISRGSLVVVSRSLICHRTFSLLQVLGFTHSMILNSKGSAA